MRRIVLTGGPGAGKTVISQTLVDRFPDRFVRVPEAATQVYSDLATRWDKLDTAGQKRVQRLIFAHQIHQENAVALAHPDQTLLLDRGTIDGAAYWPDGPAAYWVDLGTTLAAQLSRYDQVIWLETAAALGIYDGDQSNPVRFETPADAVASGQVLRELWRDHANLYHIGAFVTLEDKVQAVLEAIRDGVRTAKVPVRK